MKVSENKPHSIHLRLTDEQYTFLFNDAQFMGISVTDYVRLIINMTMNTAKKVKANVQMEMQLGDLANENINGNIEHIV